MIGFFDRTPFWKPLVIGSPPLPPPPPPLITNPYTNFRISYDSVINIIIICTQYINISFQFSSDERTSPRAVDSRSTRHDERTTSDVYAFPPSVTTTSIRLSFAVLHRRRKRRRRRSLALDAIMARTPVVVFALIAAIGLRRTAGAADRWARATDRTATNGK